MNKHTLHDILKGVATADGTPLGGLVRHISSCDGVVSLRMRAHDPSDEGSMSRTAIAIRDAISTHASRNHAPFRTLQVEYLDASEKVVKSYRFDAASASAGQARAPRVGHTPIPGLKPQTGTLADVRRIIAVGAGKGGVGKSTIALNLAVGLARRGQSVGLLDADIYGPSMPTMLGLSSYEAVVHQGLLQPFLAHGVKCMTIGKLVDTDKPLIWRGPMAHGAFSQLAEQTQWGELDTLIIDLPPGTGDVSLSMAQMLSLTGAVVVCTPQKVAQDDAIRAAKMFETLKVPVLGVVENMSCFVGDDGKVYDIFGRGGARQMSERLGVPFLGEVPITMSLRENSDSGDPTRNFTDQSEPGRRLLSALESLVTAVDAQAALVELKRGETRPTLTIS